MSTVKPSVRRPTTRSNNETGNDFRADDAMHRPPDGYHISEAADWDPNQRDPDEIDDH